MNDLDILVNMKSEALITRICMSSTDIGESLAAQEEFHALVDAFFARYSRESSPDHATKSKEDTDYFVALLDEAIQQTKKKMRENL